MANPRLAVLKDEFTLKRAEVDALDIAAADAGRDLTDSERADYDAALKRMEAIEADVKAIDERDRKFAAVAAVTTRSSHSAPARTAPRLVVPTHAEQLTIMRQAAHGDQAARDQLDNLTRAAQDGTLVRSLQHGTSADGTAPTTIEGDLVKLVDARRPLVNASRQMPMPDNHAPSFKRPRVTQFTSVDVQAAQGDVLSSRTLTATGDTVTKATFGGTVAVSEQENDWTDPSLVALIPQDLAEQYAISTEAAHVSAVVAAITANTVVAAPTAALDAFVASVLSAVVATYNTAKRIPTVLFASVDRWAYIAGLLDDDKRPAFPISNPINSLGTNQAGVTSFEGLNVLGLQVVVSPQFSSDTWGVMVPSLVEHYEQPKGLLQIQAPSTLETIIAYRGYVASNVYAQGLTGFVDA